MTHQRELLLDVIESAESHLDADELYRRARERDRRISLSTVYRTLSLLKRHDLVDELHLSEEHHHYEAKSGVEHYHVVCQECGSVEEFASPLTVQLRAEVEKRYSFDVTGLDIEIVGRCRRCRAG
jgi:Fe2+ or Zn2+ uptake regulation protein